MARDKKPVFGSPEPQQEEMTVVVVKFKGGAESMQKGFDAVNSAIAALGPSQPNHHPRVTVQRPAAQLPPAPQNGHVIDAEHEDIVEDPEAMEAEHETPAPAAMGSRKSRSHRSRVFSAISILRRRACRRGRISPQGKMRRPKPTNSWSPASGYKPAAASTRSPAATCSPASGQWTGRRKSIWSSRCAS